MTIPALHSVEHLLQRTLMELGITGRVSLGDHQIEAATNKLVQAKSEWLPASPTFVELEAWVSAHWNLDEKPHPPPGTVCSDSLDGITGGHQLDPDVAACKLLLAASIHGAGAVAGPALDFAHHGMVENRYILLFRGAQVSDSLPLDSYSRVKPYSQVFETISKEDWPVHDDRWNWPSKATNNVCAVETVLYEFRHTKKWRYERHVSRLLQDGVETFALLLGLIWGKGLWPFGNWLGIRRFVAATLPYFGLASTSGRGMSQAFFPLLEHPRRQTQRPLDTLELDTVLKRYVALPDQERNRVALALRRLRGSTERHAFGREDQIIDLCIALEALFKEAGEFHDHRRIIASRSSWHFAHSIPERDRIRKVIKELYDRRGEIVHGDAPDPTSLEGEGLGEGLVIVDDVVRASVKSMIFDGRPPDWLASDDHKDFRHRSSPFKRSEILSWKSDSLSWTLEEQEEIDQALEAVWKPSIDSAPEPSVDATSVTHQGIQQQVMAQYRREGTYFAIVTPASLYMAHPKWLAEASEPLDDRLRYYCERDVEKHFQRWQRAAGEKKIHTFYLELEQPAELYLPERFGAWREILEPGAPTLKA